ncbi:SNF1-related protein kinase regulatory subunit beta-2-like [Olea europaea var. sylvestris]|uniref:SNF1-related protein kinase regulatory subunit beta-2-like n=1 Tax=Olea europaea var. sylvestris TaxID=158386 RepID=UPI000C1D6092|nr:SNF1-related protein kinase regulatory subunit beta-2-like [Olea europaea var. sylvestris]
MDSILSNKIWELVDLPPGSKPIGSLIYDLHDHQMDVKTTFLNGNFNEEVYMEQLEGFVLPGNEDKNPFQRAAEMNIAGPSWMNTTSMYEEEMHDEPGIPTIITWTHGGREVYVVGSWDNWRKSYGGWITLYIGLTLVAIDIPVDQEMNIIEGKRMRSCDYSQQRMRRTREEFVVMRKIPAGVYQYRFIVDRQWRYAPDIPWELDGSGNACNILDVKDYVPDVTKSIASFESPESPDSSYNNSYPGPEHYEKDPPMVPPHLEYTLLNAPSPHMEIPPPLSKPQPGVLDHLYMQNNASNPSVVALGSTTRFHSKYVTVVLYKSTQTRG